ncbi:MAG: hypothetical protein M3M99_06115, partial [Actinomycetota bacterium]|nr:hypothetical protein [Actinomycetota bacterium]
MEGRPPPFDPDDDFDFDFDSVRRRRSEDGGRGAGTEEREVEPLLEDDDADAAEGAGEAPARRGRPRLPGIKLPRIRLPGSIGGTRRKPRADTSERALPGEPVGSDLDDEISEGAYETGERTYADEGGGPPPVDTAERLLRDDPYTPAEVPVPGSRRSRRRDLPAKVRRRQAIGLGAIAALVLGGTVLAFSGGGSDEPEPLPVKKLVGQSIIGKLGKEGVNPQLVKRVRKGQLGGVIVEPRNEQQVQDGVAQLQEAADAGGNPPLLILIDQEGGSVKRLPNGPPERSPSQLGREGDADAARSEGEATGDFLAGIGVNVDLAPVLDVQLPQTADTIANRTFSDDPYTPAEVPVPGSR